MEGGGGHRHVDRLFKDRMIDRGGTKDPRPVVEPSADTASLHESSDRWGTRRIWIACACSAVFTFSPRMADFLPLGASGLLWPHGSFGSLQGAIRPLFEFLSLIVVMMFEAMPFPSQLYNCAVEPCACELGRRPAALIGNAKASDPRPT